MLRVVRYAVAVATAVVVAAGLGYAIPGHPFYAMLAAVAVLALGLSLSEPALIPLLALPVLPSPARVSVLGVGLTVSDVALAIASLSAFVAAYRGVDPPTRRILWLIALYQFVTVFALLNNVYRANIVEWVHAGVLTAGGLLVGWTVGVRGFARHGVRLLVGMSAFLALGALVLAARSYAGGDFGPIYPLWPYFMHKNLAGTVFALGAITCYVRPPWAGLTRWQAAIAFYVLAGALLATQSRQAMIGLALAIGIVAIGRHPEARRSRIALIIAAVLLVVAWVMVRDQLRSGDRFNSINTRTDFYTEALAVWRDHPWIGAGLRWWYTDRYPVSFQPPNAELEVLTTVGVVGLIAFLIHIIGTWLVLRRLEATYALLALMVLLVRLTQSQFDIYWVSVQASLPFVLIGLSLGARAHDQNEVPWLRDIHHGSRSARPRRPAEVSG
ncbi:MAG: O-antigen ligase family protein [Tetrasphaera sp.]